MEARKFKRRYCNQDQVGGLLIWDRETETALWQHYDLEGPFPVKNELVEKMTEPHNWNQR